MAPGLFFLASITDPGTGEFVFNAIPNVFRRLILKGTLQSSAAAVSDIVWLLTNGDLVAANYYQQNSFSVNGAGNDLQTPTPAITLAPGTAATPGAYSSSIITLEDYAGPPLQNAQCQFVCPQSPLLVAAGGMGMSHIAAVAPITQLNIRTDNHPVDTLLGTMTLYGEL